MCPAAAILVWSRQLRTCKEGATDRRATWLSAQHALWTVVSRMRSAAPISPTSQRMVNNLVYAARQTGWSTGNGRADSFVGLSAPFQQGILISDSDSFSAFVARRVFIFPTVWSASVFTRRVVRRNTFTPRRASKKSYDKISTSAFAADRAVQGRLQTHGERGRGPHHQYRFGLRRGGPARRGDPLHRHPFAPCFRNGKAEKPGPPMTLANVRQNGVGAVINLAATKPM
jgi:hypothetical protein